MKREKIASTNRRLPKAACTNVDPLLEGKRQYVFSSLALISTLSMGAAVNALRQQLDGGKCTTDEKKARLKEK